MKKGKWKKLFNESVWTMLTVFFGIMLAVVFIGSSIAEQYQSPINGVLGINPYVKVDLEDGEQENTEYFKSDYYKQDGSYDNEAMRAHSEELALQAAMEGSVILWNDEQALPLNKGAKISLFGMSGVNYLFLENGSGGMSVVPKGTSLKTVLTDAGFQVNNALYNKYMSCLGSGARQMSPYKTGEPSWGELGSPSSSVSKYGDAAVMIISRESGEGRDITEYVVNEHLDKNNFLELDVNEDSVLTHLKELKDNKKISKIIVLINTAHAMCFEHLANDYGIDACVWVGEGGRMSYEQVASVLTGEGDYPVSGHLTDTFTYNAKSAPAYINYGKEGKYTPISEGVDTEWDWYGGIKTHNGRYVVYQEGIYVGYRYYETRYEDCVLNRGNAQGAAGIAAGNGSKWSYGEEVAFPFGYGLSYTTFAYSDFGVEKDGGNYNVSVTVKNTGDKYSGKETLQVYLQKPYTDYDKEKGIEKAAVELAGFAKSDNLAPGQSQKLTVTVAAEDFKTYDAYGEETYILEAGDYYIAAGTNAHDALNNILAAKGKTTADGMDYNGNASFVEKVTVSKSDYEKYSKSSQTGYEITNQFDNADLNLYEGTKDQHISYLSRKDWNATFPVAETVLKCVDDKMVYDMQVGHEIAAKEGDEMPVYGTVTAEEGELTLAMLMELEYDDEKWQDLLNQMTLEEQQWMCSYGLHFLAGAESVAAPGLKAKDGPCGIKESNLGMQMAFPCPTTMAATWNTELIEKLGDAMGMEVLHLGFTGLYAPGANIHRTAYEGRTFEYYSEDGFLSGKMLSSEVKGLQNRGLIVFTKHLVLNESETNRIGVSTWANEQSIREIYLKPFEYAVSEGHMNGVMSSFNRLGCTWSGAHRGLLTEVLRNEWGFVGLVETDAVSGAVASKGEMTHMIDPNAKAAGLLAGNDVWMDGGSESYFSDYTDNPTVMLALREACHRILYCQLHSNAMNGTSTSTRIVRITTWWQEALAALRITVVVIFVLCLIMAVVSYALLIKRRVDIKKGKGGNNK